MRMGAARALDVDDYRRNAEQPHLDIVHRPETGTPVKNGANGERRSEADDAGQRVARDPEQHGHRRYEGAGHGDVLA